METARDTDLRRSGSPLSGQPLTATVEFAAESTAARLAPTEERPPLSPAQQRLWAQNRLDPKSAARNIPMAVRLTGRLDLPALRRAAEDVLQRHEVLRTRYPESEPGVPYQEILSVDEVLPDGLVVERSADIGGRVAELISTGFDVTTQVPVRVRLLTGDDRNDYLLIVVAHHICADRAAMNPLARDLMTAYRARLAGDAPDWAPLATQYADFAKRQRAILGSDEDENSLAARQSAYWRERLAGLPETPVLPLTRPRPAIASQRCAVVDFLLPAAVHAGLDTAARQQDSSLFTVVHAALAVLLARISGSSDVVIGMPTTGRTEPGLEDLVGLFANTLILRTAVDPAASFADLIRQAGATRLAACANADIPFERVVETAAPGRTPANPLPQVVLSAHDSTAPALELPGLTVAALDVDLAAATFDLQIGIEPGPATGDAVGELGIVFSYATDIFDDDTIDCLGDDLGRILTAVAADPDIPVRALGIDDASPELDTPAQATVGESAVVAVEPTPVTLTLSAARGTALTRTLTTVVDDDPDGPALARGEDVLTYRELDARSSRLARVLIGRGSGPGTGVALRLARGVDAAVATWAVLKAGAALVPVATAVHGIEAIHGGAAGFDVKVGVTLGAVPADGIDWLALDDPAVADEIAAASARPVTYADRVRALRGDDPAYIHGAATLGYDQLAAIADGVLTAAELTYESRTYTLAGPESALALIESVTVGLAGATVTLPAGAADDLTGALADEWVTHLFADHTRLAEIDPAALADLRGVITDAAPGTARWATPTPVVVLPER
ncbi:AMP-binding protein [Nocardia sp. 2]|uniref:AMP-binding protein n=1 Tax=Nocardia acididurans TaxID=2802282 RepID=A0ABS1M400_9NOCA|nr:condensation domain-containing protein [Nocardia acididurans]MBL1075305.1 AMP-binding protein [Nocardia acididurans]